MISAKGGKKHRLFLILMLGALNTITPLSIDMYLPGFIQIAHDLHSTTTNIAFSVSSYFLGFSFGQILYGPLLDRFGRKQPLYVGLSFYIIATLGCIIPSSLEMLLVMRFLQALSGCVAAVAAMAMVRDFFSVDESAGIISLMILILGVSPLLAPTLGGFIINAWSWHFVFVALAIIALLLLLTTIFFLPEGHQPDPSISLHYKPIIKGFLNILMEPRFYIFAFAGSFSFSGLFVYVAASPVVFMDGFHMNANLYGGIFALLSIGFIGGSQLNHFLTRKFSNQKIFRVAVIIQVIVSSIFLAGVASGWFGLTATLVCLFIFLSCAGITYPNAASIALSPFTKNAGSASALLGFIQIGLGALISSGVGVLRFKGNLSMALTMTVASLIAVIILFAAKPKLQTQMGTT
ncbi:MAG: multidrug effflux MFS transporter [Ginsengibacter sp.]